MKLLKILFAILLFFNISKSIAQDRLGTNSHKWVTQEAWELVKLQYPNLYYGFFNDKIGYFNEGYPSNDFQNGTVMAGTIREDVNDIVYDLSWDCSIWGRHTSTHFWDADEGDEITWWQFDCVYRQALQKLISYWHLRRKEDNTSFLKLGLSENFRIYHRTTNQLIWIRLTLPDNINLAQGIQNPSLLMVNKWSVIGSPQEFLVNMPIDLFFTTVGITTYENNNYLGYFNKVLWEILGRMCHLLEDMSIPAHVHLDIHDGSDSYENSLENQYTIRTRGHALSQGGLIKWHLLCNPFRTIMYVQNQIADRFPSNDENGDWALLNFGPDDYQFKYNEIWSVYTRVAGIPVVWPGLTPELYNAILDNSYVYSMRCVAGLLYYVYRIYYDVPSPPFPVLQTVYQNPNWIHPGMSGTVTVILQQGLVPSDYNWTWIEKNPDRKPNGVTYSINNNVLNINWSNYLSVFDERSKEENQAWYFSVSAKGVCNNILYKNVFPILVNGILGCPWLFIQTQDSNIIPENNILHKSLLPENYGENITDKYIVKTTPGIIDNKIFMNIIETNNDSTILNRIRLFAVDHPVGTKLGITNDNEIVMFDSASVVENTFASLYDPDNNFTEITEDVMFHKEPKNPVMGDTLYNIYAEFKNHFVTNPAIIAFVQKSYPIIAKDYYSGIIIGNTPDGSTQSYFMRRENPDNIILPVTSRNLTGTIDSAHIIWDKSFDIRYLAVASLAYSGFTITEQPLTLAYHTQLGDVTQNLLYIDSLSSFINPDHYINLEFQNIPDQSGEDLDRDYLIEVNGKVIPIGSQRMQLSNIRKLNNETVDKYSLSQNYPNPFNPTTKINFAIPKQGLVTLKVYDVLGREVANLVNEVKTAGNYIVDFDASYLASGVYFYKLEVNGFSDVKRLVLIK